MNAFLEFLTQRISHPRLSAPAPTEQELEQVFAAAFRAPDHMRLRPWRYLTMRGEALAQFGAALEDVVVADNAEISDAQREKTRLMPLRAPLIIVGITSHVPHDKVPLSEQEVSCGVGIGYMLLALQAMGYGGMWRTGSLAYHPRVKSLLGLRADERITGFLYVGTPKGEGKSVPHVAQSDYVSVWSPEVDVQ